MEYCPPPFFRLFSVYTFLLIKTLQLIFFYLKCLVYIHTILVVSTAYMCRPCTRIFRLKEYREAAHVTIRLCEYQGYKGSKPNKQIRKTG
jgi:hypothetical protein